jgi:hypothetical protein
MFDQGPILVATTAIREDTERHVLHRAFVLDCVQKDARYLALVQDWGDDGLRQLAKSARQQLAELIAQTGDDPEDIVLYADGAVATKLHGRDALDEPLPPAAETLQIGHFVDRLLAGEATTDELATLIHQAETRSIAHIDARSPRPIGTASRHLAIRLTPRSRASRAPLQASLQEIERRWDSVSRHVEAAALIADLGLGQWPFLATDLIRRYVSELEAIIRDRQPSLEYRMGDPRRGGQEPPDLEIPAFEATGQPVNDLARLAKWQKRLDEVRTALTAAIDDPPAGRSRRARGAEIAGYRRDARWLFEHQAHSTSYRKIAQRELDSMERWRDVQKAVRRAKTYLDLADITWPLGTQQATAADDRRAALDDPSG